MFKWGAKLRPTHFLTVSHQPLKLQGHASQKLSTLGE